MNLKIRHLVIILVISLMVERADAAQFEKLGSALANALKTKKVFQKSFQTDDGKRGKVFYSKKKSGEPKRFAFVEKGLYNPGACTHTWVIALDADSQRVEQVRVVEMSCQHAFPTRKASYLKQYRGKGPADVKELKDDISTIAKATGSSDLTTDAVKRAILHAVKVRKEF